MAKRLTLLLACGLLATSLAAPAQQTDQAAQALARAQGLLRQLAQDKAQVDAELAKLRAENAKLKKDLGRGERELASTTADLESAGRETASVKATLGRTEQRLERTTAQLKDVVEKYKALARKQWETEAARAALETNLAATTRELADAERKNLALYELNREVLGEFDREGPWDGLLRKEPFTGFKRVEVENLVQEYEQKMLDQVRTGNLKAATEPRKQ
jgi:chromosome segregation ATPase